MSKRNSAKKRKKNDDEYDVLASGVSGEWSVIVDESDARPVKRSVQIKGPFVYVSFSIGTPDVIDQMLKFLTGAATSHLNTASQQDNSNGSLSIGRHNRFPIRLIRDTEFSDRFFLAVGTAESTLVRCNLSGNDLTQLKNSLSQVREELLSQSLIADGRPQTGRNKSAAVKSR